MPRKKENREQERLPLLVLLVTAVLAIGMGVTAVYSCVNSINTEKSVQAEESRQIRLKHKLKSLKPETDDITTGKFDLQKKEEELTKVYKTLASALLGGVQNANTLTRAEGTYERYFGMKGASKLFQISTADNDTQIQKNYDTRVGFSDFDINNKTVKVHIYSCFKPKHASDEAYKGVVYVTTYYSFQSGLASATSVQYALLSKDDD